MITSSLEAARQRLLARRDELADRANRADSDLRRESEPLSPDFDEQAVQRENDEVLQGLGDSAREELRRVNRALGRIADGSYFTCTRCGAPIAPARLSVLPDADRCAECAARGAEHAV